MALLVLLVLGRWEAGLAVALVAQAAFEVRGECRMEACGAGNVAGSHASSTV